MADKNAAHIRDIRYMGTALCGEVNPGCMLTRDELSGDVPIAKYCDECVEIYKVMLKDEKLAQAAKLNPQ